jgi:ABC-type polysaccharide/polyol phosphate export permease
MATIKQTAPNAMAQKTAKRTVAALARRERLMRRSRSVWVDLLLGFRLHYVWRALAWEEVRHRFRRSALGVFWIMLSFALMVTILVIVFGRNSPGYTLLEYVAYLATGLLVWNLISTTVSRGCALFSSADGWVKGSSAPFSVLAYKLVAFAVIELAMTAILVMPFIILTGGPNALQACLCLLAFLLLLIMALFCALLFGCVGAWSSDFQQLVPAIMRVGFFATPVFWTFDMRDGMRATLAALNPFTHLIEIVRRPLMGEMPSEANWVVALSLSLILAVCCVIGFRFAQPRLSAWV